MTGRPGAVAGLMIGDASRRCSFSDTEWAAARRNAIRAILGPPGFSTRDEWSHEIGVPSSRSDYSPLNVRFGRDGLVDRVRVPGFIEP